MGDLPGHEFRGNQWTNGGGASWAPDGASRKAGEPDAPHLADNEEYVSNLTETDRGFRRALESYQGIGFVDMNTLLIRDHPAALEEGPPEDADAKTEKLYERVEALDDAFYSKGSIMPETVLYRGVGGTYANETLAKLELGAEFETRGFQSTSLNPSVGADFASRHSQGGVVLEILATRGLVISPFNGESEVLLPHGSKFRVEGVRRGVEFETPSGTARLTVIQVRQLDHIKQGR